MKTVYYILGNAESLGQKNFIILIKCTILHLMNLECLQLIKNRLYLCVRILRRILNKICGIKYLYNICTYQYEIQKYNRYIAFIYNYYIYVIHKVIY